MAGRFPLLTDACVNEHLVQALRQKGFRGMVAWPQEGYETRRIGDLVRDFEALAEEDDPFVYPIRYLKSR